MVLPLSQKVAIFTNSVQGLSQQSPFLTFFQANLRAGFLNKLLILSKKNSTFVLVCSFFGSCIFTVFPTFYLKGNLNYHA